MEGGTAEPSADPIREAKKQLHTWTQRHATAAKENDKEYLAIATVKRDQFQREVESIHLPMFGPARASMVRECCIARKAQMDGVLLNKEECISDQSGELRRRQRDL